jgi:hypothetical protein
VKEYLVKRYLRHLWIGLAAGLAASPALLATQRNLYLALALAGAIGVSFALVFRHSQGAYIDSLMMGARDVASADGLGRLWRKRRSTPSGTTRHGLQEDRDEGRSITPRALCQTNTLLFWVAASAG